MSELIASAPARVFNSTASDGFFLNRRQTARTVVKPLVFARSVKPLAKSLLTEIMKPAGINRK
jgi:hypothetical protein